MIKKIALTLALALLTVFAEGTTLDITKGAVLVPLTYGQVKVTLKLEEAPRSRESCPSAASWWWGAEGQCPSVRIASFAVQYRGNSIFVPYSVFGDLGNPRSVSIDSQNGSESYVVTIKGGDAATSYTAIVKFRSNLLLSRAVRSGEFPKNAWEETTYKFNF